MVPEATSPASYPWVNIEAPAEPNDFLRLRQSIFRPSLAAGVPWPVASRLGLCLCLPVAFCSVSNLPLPFSFE